MGLRDIGDTLPPGFRFYPSDEELICHYLYKKIANEEILRGTLVEIDLHTCEPWQLPDVAKLNSSEWYFFSFRDRKYATGFRTNRATTSGYWKATGKDRTILDPISKSIVGMRKTLVFYKNRAPNGVKTGWIMHEFRLENPHVPPKEDWVLCRVFHKSIRGETSDKFSPQNDINFDFATPPPVHHENIYRNIPCNFSHTQSLDVNLNPTTNNVETLGLLSSRSDDHEIAPQYNLLSCSSLKNNNNNNNNENKVDEACKNEDDYGFLFDLDSSSGPPMSRFDDYGINGPGFM